jgi:cardiolipin synthase A/B
MSKHYQSGHELKLLEGTREYFPALIADMDAAGREVWLETYIFDVRGDGQQLALALERTAQRGVVVRLTMDGFGTPELPSEWRKRFDAAGVQWRIYAQFGWAGWLVPRNWRRLHRKLAVVDGHTAYCGGINVLDDYFDPNHGPLTHPRFDLAVRVTGPLVLNVLEAVSQLWWRGQAWRLARSRAYTAALRAMREAQQRFETPSAQGTRASADRAQSLISKATAALVLRDNVQNRGRIERAYLAAIRAAQHEVIIANAYFIPGGRMRRALVQAAKRGVRVQLLLQGRYEYFMQFHAARAVYDTMLSAGVQIYEYADSFLHAKVATVDANGPMGWATVGSSNIDPLSLLLAREANVVVRDPAFAQQLRQRLRQAMARAGEPVSMQVHAQRKLPQRLTDWLAYGLMRFALMVTGKRY